jgi:ribosomal protein L31E
LVTKKEAIVIFLHDLIKTRGFDFLLRDKRFDGYFDITYRPLQRFITPFRIQKMENGFLLRISPYRAEESIQATQYIQAIQATKAILQSINEIQVILQSIKYIQASLQFIEDIQASLQFIEYTQVIEEATQGIEEVTQVIEEATQATEKATQAIQLIRQFINIQVTRGATQAIQAILQFIEAAEEAILATKTILQFLKDRQDIEFSIKLILLRIDLGAKEAIQAIQAIQATRALQAIKAILRFIKDTQTSLRFIEYTQVIEVTQAIEEVTQAPEEATQAIQLIRQFINIEATKGATQAIKKATLAIEPIRQFIEATEEAILVTEIILRRREDIEASIKSIEAPQATKAAKDILQFIEEIQSIQAILQFIKDTQATKKATQTIHVAQLTSLGLLSSIPLFIPFLDLVSIMRLMSVCKYLHIFNIMNKAYKITGSLFDTQLHLRLGDLFTLIQDSTPREYIKQLVLDIIRNDPKAISIRNFEENQTWLPYLFVDEKYSVLLSSRLTIYSSIVGLFNQYQSFTTLLIFQDTTFELAWRQTSFTVVNFTSLVYLFLERCKIGYFGDLELKSDTLKMIQLLYNEFSLSEGWPSKIICPKNLKYLVIEHDGKSSFCIEVYESTKVK